MVDTIEFNEEAVICRKWRIFPRGHSSMIETAFVGERKGAAEQPQAVDGHPKLERALVGGHFVFRLQKSSFRPKKVFFLPTAQWK
jgi:hypothetical protein